MAGATASIASAPCVAKAPESTPWGAFARHAARWEAHMRQSAGVLSATPTWRSTTKPAAAPSVERPAKFRPAQAITNLYRSITNLYARVSAIVVSYCQLRDGQGKHRATSRSQAGVEIFRLSPGGSSSGNRLELSKASTIIIRAAVGPARFGKRGGVRGPRKRWECLFAFSITR